MSPKLERSVSGLQGDLLASIAERVLSFEHRAAALLLRGSYLTDSASQESDFDITVLTSGPPEVKYRMWFEERTDEVPLHVSVSAKSIDDWLDRRETPATWSFGLPAIDEAAYLWSTDLARERLGEAPSAPRPAATPSLEDFVETLIKVANARRSGDEVSLRLHAQGTAEATPSLLAQLNQVPPARTRREALEIALAFRQAPTGYASYLRISLGLQTATGDEVAAAAYEFGPRMLAFLREQKPDCDAQPEIARYLADGTLEQHLKDALRP